MTSAQASDDVGSIVEPTSSLAWADVILADFQRVVSRYLQSIRIYLFYKAGRLLRTIFMQNSKLIKPCFPIKIDFASVMIHDVGCSRCHQCPQCEHTRYITAFMSCTLLTITNGVVCPFCQDVNLQLYHFFDEVHNSICIMAGTDLSPVKGQIGVAKWNCQYDSLHCQRVFHNI